jgi:hypothetical protein
VGIFGSPRQEILWGEDGVELVLRKCTSRVEIGRRINFGLDCFQWVLGHQVQCHQAIEECAQALGVLVESVCRRRGHVLALACLDDFQHGHPTVLRAHCGALRPPPHRIEESANVRGLDLAHRDVPRQRGKDPQGVLAFGNRIGVQLSAFQIREIAVNLVLQQRRGRIR